MTTPTIDMSNDHLVINQLAEHFRANYCDAYGGEFSREAFLHWIDIGVPLFPEELEK